MNKLLDLGEVYTTARVFKELRQEDVLIALQRHVFGDWGNLSEEDKRANDDALKYEERVLSSYVSSDGKKFWIITEADRSSTTVLFPEEY